MVPREPARLSRNPLMTVIGWIQIVVFIGVLTA
jgi:hypothetical protein